MPIGQNFERLYAGQPEVWSRAYRTEALCKAENRFEEFHVKLSRHIYHEGFKRKQLDVLIKVTFEIFNFDSCCLATRKCFVIGG